MPKLALLRNRRLMAQSKVMSLRFMVEEDIP